VLEVSGRLTLLDQNKVIKPHPSFPSVLDRQHGWPRRHLGPLSRHPADQPGPDGPLSIVTTLNYLAHDEEVEIVLAKAHHYRTTEGRDIVNKDGAARRPDPQRVRQWRPVDGDEPGTVITWAENADIFGDIRFAFRVTFLNKCARTGTALVARFYQRCFNRNCRESAVNVALS